MKVLMVCLGNICRSPLAEGVLKAKVQKHGLNWNVDSAGTSDWHVNEPPDKRSIRIAKTNSINISAQRARQFQEEDFEDFDLILAMDSSNYQNIRAMARSKEQLEKLELILNYSSPGMNMNVPDPYYNDNFEYVFELLDKACEALIQKFG